MSPPVREGGLFIAHTYLFALVVAPCLAKSELAPMLTVLTPLLGVAVVGVAFVRRGNRRAFWPPSGDTGIFYDDLGQSVPPPGMVRLGTLDSGLDTVASAGNRFIARIYPVDQNLLIRRHQPMRSARDTMIPSGPRT